MKTTHITDENKSYIIRRYTDYVVSRMDNVEIWEAFKDYFYKEKISYQNHTLEEEIKRYCPDILEDTFPENVIGKGTEYAKAI